MDSQRLNLSFVAKEDQTPWVICSVSLGSILQRVLVFTYFTLGVLPCSHCTWPLCSYHPIFLSSLYKLHTDEKPENNSLRSCTACRSAHHRCRVGAELGKMRTMAYIQNLPHLLRSIQQKAKLLKTPCKTVYCWRIIKHPNKSRLYFKGSGHGKLAKARCQRHWN